jgi:hypothetical protein
VSPVAVVGVVDVVAVSVQAAHADAVNDTTNKTASKTLTVFFILSNVCLPIYFHSQIFTQNDTSFRLLIFYSLPIGKSVRK